jgi:hypothetical protein
MKGDNPVVWDEWRDAARWDEDTDSHLHQNSSEKMRNHLAEEILDLNMLNLMQNYKQSLKNGHILGQ